MVTYYIRALEHNHFTNDKRVRLYKRGWIFAMISLGLFVCYICLNKKIRTPFRIYCKKEFLLFIIYLSDVGGILSAPSLTERRPKLLSRILQQ
mgnify:CR=1 FL=1